MAQPIAAVENEVAALKAVLAGSVDHLVTEAAEILDPNVRAPERVRDEIWLAIWMMRRSGAGERPSPAKIRAPLQAFIAALELAEAKFQQLPVEEVSILFPAALDADDGLRHLQAFLRPLYAGAQFADDALGGDLKKAPAADPLAVDAANWAQDLLEHWVGVPANVAEKPTRRLLTKSRTGRFHKLAALLAEAAGGTFVSVVKACDRLVDEDRDKSPDRRGQAARS